MNQEFLAADQCLKCNICTAACPVAKVTDLFLGPKAVGPQAYRFRHPHASLPDVSEAWCSSCGTCSLVCPHDVPVAEMIAKMKERSAGEVSLRDRIISRPETLGRLASRFTGLANSLFRSPAVRSMLDKYLGISSKAVLPTFSRTNLRRSLRDYSVKTPNRLEEISRLTVGYFHGCSTNYFEPGIGEFTIAILERLGLYVFLPPQVCCGLPLQSNGLFDAARKLANQNIRYLEPFLREKIPIVGTSPSCTLALKHDYRTILGIDTEESNLLANSTYDFFEFILLFMSDELSRIKLRPVPARALYHPPCQLRSHGIGTPALSILRNIPGLELEVSDFACCGAAGTYGMKSERFEIAYAIGERLFRKAIETNADFIMSDSETCRWWIAEHTNLPAYHPLEILARSMGIV
ncbi:MAG: anaerobic glycerol-3-phosphate dehydrogenase subunit C [Anaerolineales bacterium]|jgi:glycerol-3-phosphate dehydrogenase subunit C